MLIHICSLICSRTSHNSFKYHPLSQTIQLCNTSEYQRRVQAISILESSGYLHSFCTTQLLVIIVIVQCYSHHQNTTNFLYCALCDFILNIHDDARHQGPHTYPELVLSKHQAQEGYTRAVGSQVYRPSAFDRTSLRMDFTRSCQKYIIIVVVHTHILGLYFAIMYLDTDHNIYLTHSRIKPFRYELIIMSLHDTSTVYTRPRNSGVPCDRIENLALRTSPIKIDNFDDCLILISSHRWAIG